MGEALVRYIISQTDHHVINVDKLAYAVTLDPLTETMDHLRHHFQKVDICHAQAIEELLAHYQPDAIMHLAAETHVNCSVDDSADFIQNNIVGTFSLLKSTRKIGSDYRWNPDRGSGLTIFLLTRFMVVWVKQKFATLLMSAILPENWGGSRK